ncbi:uncharacterized protein BYT42DRAFT_614550 [Radiomyces spectabilis]|uniref:uncharacterized protein n=1 Tax=Radiomyces spectabilis TaxID=64574 RepID=UPI0022201898|nr:uncharacterized protein BYT42DRAFT_614550 [Radiomyces spectabilis]KAI8377901.1 hypothetical protein BYT42DRAFT_614550 [Radiomyces spectabilis]
MKDGFRSVSIEPFETYLDFLGPATTADANSFLVLKGEARLSLCKSVKIRSMVVKFKGYSTVCLQHHRPVVKVSTPLLPKLKRCLYGKTTLSAGNHTIPWDIDIPNIYPRSLLTKRAAIHYKVELSISYGLNKTMAADYPIVLCRHLLPSIEMAPLIETRVYESTLPAKFHYEVQVPQIVCLEQQILPMCIKYLCFANQKPVRSIRTQLIQTELYRCHSISKSLADLQHGPRPIPDTSGHNYAQYIKRSAPAMIATVDNHVSAWKQPLVLRLPLNQYLSVGIESPLVALYHQLEVTFQFEHKFENIKAKIPVMLASVPLSQRGNLNLANLPASSYPFEMASHIRPLTVEPESRSSKGQQWSETTASQMVAFNPPPAQKHNQQRRSSALKISVSNIDLPFSERSALSDSETKSLKKFASAFDLGAVQSGEASSFKNRLRRKIPPPIDTELANGGRSHVAALLQMKHARTQKEPVASTTSQVTMVAGPHSKLAESSIPTNQNVTHASQTEHHHEAFETTSFQSEASLSSHNAPSLTTSHTYSTLNISRQTLLQQQAHQPRSSSLDIHGLENYGLVTEVQIPKESLPDMIPPGIFIESPVGPMSPSIATVASSTVLSPHTVSTLQARLERQTSLSTNPRFNSPSRSLHEDATVKHYLHAKLPPLPVHDASKRMTRLYLDDSDDELDGKEGVPEPPLPAPPAYDTDMLPRLSFGASLGIALGLDV